MFICYARFDEECHLTRNVVELSDPAATEVTIHGVSLKLFRQDKVEIGLPGSPYSTIVQTGNSVSFRSAAGQFNFKVFATTEEVADYLRNS